MGSWKDMTTSGGEPSRDYGAGSRLNSDWEYQETLEECYGMVWMLAHWLLPAKATREDALALIKRAQEEYKTGVSLGKKTDW